MTSPDDSSPKLEDADRPQMPRRRGGLSLRVSLGMMAFLAIVLGFWANHARQMREATAMIRKHHGMYYYDFEYLDYVFVAKPRSWAPQWMRALIGDECLHDVVYVRITDPSFNDQDLSLLSRRFPKVKSLGIDGTSITDRGLANLRGNRSLTALFVKSKGITDAGIDLLGLETLPNLSLLDVRNTQVSDFKAAEIQKFLVTREADKKRANPGKRIDSHSVWSGRGGSIPENGNPRDVYEKGLETSPPK